MFPLPWLDRPEMVPHPKTLTKGTKLALRTYRNVLSFANLRGYEVKGLSIFIFIF